MRVPFVILRERRLDMFSSLKLKTKQINLVEQYTFSSSSTTHRTLERVPPINHIFGWSNPSLGVSDGKPHGTTVLCVRKLDKVVMIADGQVTAGGTVVKHNAKKIRRLGVDRDILAGFAGATADAFTLFERLEEKLEQHGGQLLRSCVDMAKSWRTDKYLRRLEAMMIVSNKDTLLTMTGDGDVLEHADGIVAIGSGGGFALAAARALCDFPELTADDIVKRAMQIAADICIHTNHNFTIEELMISSEHRTTPDIKQNESSQK